MHYPLVTIVGGSGFVGRHTVKLLAAQGYRLRILVRDTVAAEFLKTSATVGQIAIEHADITRPETLAGKFAGSDAVVSLVSILYESGRQKFDTINVAGAKAVATEAVKAEVKTLVHVSALAIDSMGNTRYGATKLAGEAAVRDVFPAATFLRPSLVIGPEDGFFQRFARMSLISSILPLISSGNTKFQPVLVTDVAKAIAAALSNPEAKAKTYEIAGPSIYSMRQLLEMMGRISKRKLRFISLPARFAKLHGFICEQLPFTPMITRDQVKLLAHDNVLSKGALALHDLGIAANPIESMLPTYLSRYVKV